MEEVSDSIVPIILRVLMFGDLIESLFVHIEGDVLLFAELSQGKQGLFHR